MDEYLNYWTKNLDKINLSLPDDQKSVCISTIHKSKGLEYPAVILPIYNDKLDENSFNDSLWLYEPFSEIESLEWMLIKRIKDLNQNGHNLKEVYDSTVLNNYIDSINLLYVAFTRAEQELYILANNNEVSPNSISFLIKEFLDYKSCKNNFSFGKKIKSDISSDNKEKLDLSGKIKIAGQNVNNFPIYLRTKKFKVGYVPQYGGFFNDLTLHDNLKAISEIVIENKNYRAERINYLISKFDLDNLKEIKAKFLSGGQKKKLVIALSLLSEPNVLLLDECFAALDVLTIKMLQEIIVNLQKENQITICICDHQARDLLACVDGAMILSNGKIVAQDTPSNLVKDINAKNAYFGDGFKIN